VCWIQTTKNIGKKTKGEKPENFHHPRGQKTSPHHGDYKIINNPTIKALPG
jgi:hypothetical protein